MPLVKLIFALLAFVGFVMIVAGFLMACTIILIIPGVALMAMGAMLAIPAGKALEALE